MYQNQTLNDYQEIVIDGEMCIICTFCNVEKGHCCCSSLIIKSQKAIVRLKGFIEQEVLKGSDESWDAKFYGRLIKAHKEKIAGLTDCSNGFISYPNYYDELQMKLLIDGEIFITCKFCNAGKENCSC